MRGERFQQSIYIDMDILGVLNPIGECKVLLKLALLEHSGSRPKFEPKPNQTKLKPKI